MKPYSQLKYDTITTRIPAALNVRLTALAFSEDVPRAELVRKAIEEYLENHTPLKRKDAER
jgi:predicted DNA-binding protein